jgi:hypothetical protein
MEKERSHRNQNQDDRFSRMMFGDKRNGMRSDHHNVPESNQNSIDFESIIENIVKLKDSSQNLKPLFQMVYPFVEPFLKKK